MSAFVFTIVLVAALIHAAWNTWLKVSGDRFVALGVMVCGWALLALVAIPFVGWSPRAGWPYLGVSTFVHTAYALALAAAYRVGDLNVIYAISRGIGPLLVALASVLVLGEDIGAAGWVAVMAVTAGVIGLGISSPRHARAAVGMSVLIGCLIAVYTFIDGVGGRVSGSPHAYANSLFLLSAAVLFAIVLAVRGRRFFALARPMWLKGLVTGVLSATGYWLVIWAMSVAPMGLVAATRESSVALAALLAWALLRERVRWAALVLVVGGMIMIRLAV